MIKRIHTFVVTGAVVFFLALSPLYNGEAEGRNPLLDYASIGKEAPDFTLEDVSGKRVSLSSFKGNPVLLNFWATWCPYCRKERGHLNTFYSDYRDKGLIILSVSTDSSVNRLREFLKKTPADFIVLSDSKRMVASSYSINGLPTSYLINSDGVIGHKFTGFREWSSPDLRKLIDQLLND